MKNIYIFWQNNKKNALHFFQLLILSLLIAFFNSPYTHNPDIDVELFRYIGNGIYNGKILYKELFDHKPPIIHFIAALVHPFGIWGNWLFAVIISSITSFWLLKLSKFYKLKSLFILPIIFLLLIFWQRELFARYADSRFFSVNFITILICAYLIYPTNKFILKGILSALILFTQQNEVTYPFFLFFLFAFIYRPNSYNNFFNNLFKLLIGALFIIAPIGLYFYYNNAFYDFIYATYLFNQKYFWYAMSFKEHLLALITLFKYSSLTKYFLLVIILSSIVFIFNKNKLYSKMFYAAFFCTLLGIFNTMVIGHYLLYYTFNFIVPCLFFVLFLLVIHNNKMYKYKINSFVYLAFLAPLVLKPSIVSYAYFRAKEQKLNSTAYNNYFKDIYDTIAAAPKTQQTLFLLNTSSACCIPNKLNIPPINKWCLNYFWYDAFFKRSKFDEDGTIFSKELLEPLAANKPNFIICNAQHQMDTLDYRADFNKAWRPFLYNNYTLIKIANNNNDMMLFKLNK